MAFMVWCLCLTIQGGFLFVGARAFSRYQRGKNKNKPTISVIIAAKDEEKNLQALIPQLLNQEYPNFEIIIALDRCTDNSKEILLQFKSERLNAIEITDVPALWNAKKYALSKAIEQSQGDWLVFTDADCIPESPHWLQSLVLEMYPETTIIIGVSPYTSRPTLLNQYIQFETLSTAFQYVSRALLGNPYMAVGRNLAINKSFFIKTDGYQAFKSINGGDDDLFIQKNATKANTRVVLGKQNLVFTKPENNWKSYLIQKMRHLSVGSNYQPMDLFRLTIWQLSLLGCWILAPFAVIHVFFLPIFLFYLLIKFMSYRFAADKMEVNVNYMLFPLVDMMYAFFTPVIAVMSKIQKDIPWKN